MVIMSSPSTPILHVDMDAFFAAVEERADPRLAGRPLLVGGGPAGREVVTTASYPARRFGVRSGMSLREAFRLCPAAVYRPVDPPRYVSASQALIRIFEAFTPALEPASIDEVFLDLAGVAGRVEGQKAIALEIQKRVMRLERLSCSVGLGPNKLQAKMASGLEKPAGLTQLLPGDFARCFSARPTRDLWGIGPQTSALLAALGISTIGALAAAPVPELERLFGVAGRVLPRMAEGEGGGPVVPYYESAAARSMGHEQTLESDECDPERLGRFLLLLSDRLARRLRREGYAGHLVILKLRFADRTTITRQKALAWPVDDERELLRQGRALFTQHYAALPADARRPVRLIGLSAGHLVATAGVLPLFPEDRKQRTLIEARDRLRDRFGETVLLPAGVLRLFRR